MRTRRFYVIGFALLAIIDTAIQVAFKLAARRTGPFEFTMPWFRTAIAEEWIYVAIAGYLITFVAWMTLLEHAPIGPAFVASHLQVVTVLAASILFFHEHLQGRQVVGATCILAGIACIGFSGIERGQRTCSPAAEEETVCLDELQLPLSRSQHSVKFPRSRSRSGS